MSPKELVDHKIHAMPLFPHYVIRVLGSVAGLGAHAPLIYMYIYIYNISAGPLVGHTAVEEHFRYKCQVPVSSI